MVFVCESQDRLIISTQENRLVFIDKDVRPIKKIHLQEKITSLSLLNYSSLLLVGTEGGNLKTSVLSNILDGSSTNSVDYLFTHVGQVSQITDQLLKIGVSELIVAASDTGLHFGFFDTVMQSLTFEGTEP